MKRAMILIAACLACGCATIVEKEWTETDPDTGVVTAYKTRTVVPPFGQLAEGADDMSASVNVKGDWKLAIGGGVRGVDNSGQIDALAIVAEFLVKVGAMGAGAAVAPVP